VDHDTDCVGRVRASLAVCVITRPASASVDGGADGSADGGVSPGLQLEVLTNSCGDNQMQDFFEVINTGTTAVPLSQITVKFWLDDTSGQTIDPHVWTGGCVTYVNGNPSCVH
jgi:hypothetical protein